LRSPAAVVHPSATLGEGVALHAGCVVERGATVGARCVLYPGAYVGEQAVLGDDCVLFPGATVYDHCRLGHRVTLHAHAVIGSDGFGYATHKGRHEKIPQAGIVVLEDDVEINFGATIMPLTQYEKGCRLRPHAVTVKGQICQEKNEYFGNPCRADISAKSMEYGVLLFPGQGSVSAILSSCFSQPLY
jgi:carbonic anhydrase/acetyltransferase-like protein (isoleucine patch superfamily)